MKKINIFVIVLAFLVVLPLFAADHYGVNVSRKYTNDATLVYYGSFTMTTDSTANWYTDAMWIGGLNSADARVYVTCSNSASGTEDVNVFPGFYNLMTENYPDSLNDTNFTFLAAFAGLDQVTQGAWKSDSLDISAGAETLYNMSDWMSLKFDGQAGHPDDATVYFQVVIPLPEIFQGRKVGQTRQTY